MDPVSQGVLGSIASQQVAKKGHIKVATLLGLLSGMAPDLDVVVRSSTDPLLALEYHRHFTHSLVFIPVGGLICAFIFFLLFARRSGLSFGLTYLYCTLGIATHGFLDACTTYGTQLLWPFSDMRVAWNTISIIDPLFSIPLISLVILGLAAKRRWAVRASLVWVLVYLSLGTIQRERAEAVGMDLAQSRGHDPISLEAKPSFANILVWKVVYATQHDFYVDAVKVGLATRVYEGDSVQKLDVSRDFPWLDPDSQQAKDIGRFRWFSNDYLAVSPYDSSRIIDIRYSMLPNEIRGLWGINVSRGASFEGHVEYTMSRDASPDTQARLWRMIVD